jgi:hypothetical protein
MNKRAWIKHLHVVSLSLLLLVLSIFVLSCQESVPEPSKPWTADGIISSGEYPSEASHANGTHKLFWNSDQQYI